MDKPKILYVDDEPINLTLFKSILSKEYEVITAENGQLALGVLGENKDVKTVISDMSMPIMNGLEFIKKARLDFPDIKFYILTGYEVTKEIQEALDEGVIKKYFRKPFHLTEIQKEIS